MGVGLVRSLQPPDTLWIHWRVYNSIANTSKGVLFLSLSDVYIRSFLYLLYTVTSLHFSCSVMSDSLWPHESQHARPPCPSQTPRVYPNSCPLSQWYHPAISSSVVPFSSCPQSLPASGSFPTSQIFPWGSQSIGVSASAPVLPMNTQDWSLLGGTGWISLQSKGLSKSSPIPQFKSINFSVLRFLHSPTLTSIHDHWKNHNLDRMDLCWQSNVSAF